MSHIFISYSKQDGDFMRYLRRLLEHAGMRVWVDEARLHAGSRWWDEIEANITACEALVVIMSPDAKQSDWVEREILLAERLHRPIYPVLLAGEAWSRLANIQYEDMRAGLRDSLSDEFLERLLGVVGQRPLEFVIERGDVFAANVDVLVFKYAQSFYGADSAAAEKLILGNVPISTIKPLPGKHAFVPPPPMIDAEQFLFMGMPNLRHFGYKHLRQMGMEMFKAIHDDAPDTRTIATTIHGPGFGLDEHEALRSQFQGYVDAIQAGIIPPSLQRITIVERNDKRVLRLRETMEEMLAEFDFATRVEDSDDDTWRYDLAVTIDTETVAPQPTAEERTHAVVAMPNTPKFDDYFYYGVQGAVHGYGVLCERFPHSDLDRDQWAQIQARLDTAAVFIVDVTAYSAGIALQVGYALGHGCPVVLIGQQMPELPFEAVPAIHYKSIRELEGGIKTHLDALKAGGQL